MKTVGHARTQNDSEKQTQVLLYIFMRYTHLCIINAYICTLCAYLEYQFEIVFSLAFLALLIAPDPASTRCLWGINIVAFPTDLVSTAPEINGRTLHNSVKTPSINVISRFSPVVSRKAGIQLEGGRH